MDQSVINAISTVGFPIVCAVCLWLALSKNYSKMSDALYKLIDILIKKNDK
jgi:hypothetical protein